MSASGKYCEIFCLCGRVPAAPGSNVSFGLDKIEPIAVSQERFRGGQLGLHHRKAEMTTKLQMLHDREYRRLLAQSKITLRHAFVRWMKKDKLLI